jgi:hypothetical protein
METKFLKMANTEFIQVVIIIAAVCAAMAVVLLASAQWM